MVKRKTMARDVLVVLLLGLVAALLAARCGAPREAGLEGPGGGGRGYPAGGAMWDGEEGVAPPDNAGDSYEDVGTNPFVMAAHDPLSTFAVDVDTASYDVFRRDIGNGTLPQPESVRLEEYVNAFPYDYTPPAQTAVLPFSITVEAAPSPLDSKRTVLSVGIRGKDAPPRGKLPANLVFLVDTSGSMQGAAKLPLVKTVLSETLEVLEPNDRVGIVTYAGNVGVRLPSTPVSEKQAILDVLDSLDAGGSTAGAAGLDLAYEQAEAHFVEGGINHIVLCSDGDFNVGPSSNAELVAMIEEKRKTGITFTVLGFGTGNLNDAMMEAISNKGNGVYGVIADGDHAIEYVHERMLSTMTFIARDMKIQVEFNPAEVAAYRLLGYENRALEDAQFREDAVDAGEVGAGHTVTALYEVVLEGQDVPSPEGAPAIDDGDPFDGQPEVAAEELLRVKVRYKERDAGEEDPAFEVTSSLAPADLRAGLADASSDHQWAVAVAAFAEVLKGSPFADRAELPAVGEVLQANTADHRNREELLPLFDRAVELLAAQ